MKHLHWSAVLVSAIAGGMWLLPARGQSPSEAPEAEANVATYSLNFRFTAPKGWGIERDTHGVLLMALAPERPDGAFRESVNVSAGGLDKDHTLERYVAENVEELKQQLDATILKNADFKLGDAAGKKVVYTFWTGEMTLQGAAYATIIDGRGFTLTGTSTDEDFAKWDALFDATAKSFRVK